VANFQRLDFHAATWQRSSDVFEIIIPATARRPARSPRRGLRTSDILLHETSVGQGTRRLTAARHLTRLTARPNRLSLGMTISSGIVIAASLAAVQAIPPAVTVPIFEDVMVAPNDSRENGTYVNYIRGRLFVQNSTLRMLIRSSYGVHDSQIVGGPAWMNVDRFDIGAKGDVGNSPALPVLHEGDPSQLQLMMQVLLVDRFELYVHRERQDADVYALTLANQDGRLGPGLRRSDVDCEALAVQARQGHSRIRTEPRRCELSRDGGSLTIGGRSLSLLANSLSRMVGKPVINQTGLTGNFDVRLTWRPDRASPPTALLAVVREQLGLDLVSQTRPTDVLVVDHATPPDRR